MPLAKEGAVHTKAIKDSRMVREAAASGGMGEKRREVDLGMKKIMELDKPAEGALPQVVTKRNVAEEEGFRRELVATKHRRPRGGLRNRRYETPKRNLCSVWGMPGESSAPAFLEHRLPGFTHTLII
jgi:hypothetical protein